MHPSDNPGPTDVLVAFFEAASTSVRFEITADVPFRSISAHGLLRHLSGRVSAQIELLAGIDTRPT